MSTQKCQVEMLNLRSCKRDVVRDGRCIFHLEDKAEAEAAEFEKSFKQELERLERSESVIDLIGFVFPRRILLQRTFTKDVYFDQATFKQDAIFTFAKFLGYACFREARFSSVTSFIGAEFSGYAEFEVADFLGHADFDGAKFSGGAGFGGARFSGRTLFSSTEFSGHAQFDGAKFLGRADFEAAQFSGDAEFTEAEFSETDFGRSTFSRSAIFVGCSFGKLANFGSASFDGPAQFVKGGKDQADPVLLLHRVTFKMPKATQFCGYPLSKISFAATDITDILLVPANGDQDRILDEILIERPEVSKRDEPLDIAKRSVGGLVSTYSLIAEYKLLRKCLESNRMFTEAADIFVREMKLSRKRLTWRDSGEIVAHQLYSWVSRYGESINRPVLLSLVTIVASAMILKHVCSCGVSPNLWTYLAAVSSVFFQIKSFSNFPFLSNLSPIPELLLRLTSLTLLGNFYIALKRRLERK